MSISFSGKEFKNITRTVSNLLLDLLQLSNPQKIITSSHCQESNGARRGESGWDGLKADKARDEVGGAKTHTARRHPILDELNPTWSPLLNCDLPTFFTTYVKRTARLNPSLIPS